jgi:hypothetical protein
MEIYLQPKLLSFVYRSFGGINPDLPTAIKVLKIVIIVTISYYLRLPLHISQQADLPLDLSIPWSVVS